MTTTTQLLAQLCLLALLLGLADACGFGMMGGGGGGGCCAPPPVQSCGGGCGRKKRSVSPAAAHLSEQVLEPQLRTEQAASTCPQSEWRPALEQGLGQDLESSKFAVQGQLFKQFESKFLVTCVPAGQKQLLQFVANGEGFCGAGNDKFWCLAVLMLA